MPLFIIHWLYCNILLEWTMGHVLKINCVKFPDNIFKQRWAKLIERNRVLHNNVANKRGVQPSKVDNSSGWKYRSGQVGQPPDSKHRAGGGDSNPHFSPGSRKQAQDGARLSHQMDEPSLDLWIHKAFCSVGNTRGYYTPSQNPL